MTNNESPSALDALAQMLAEADDAPEWLVALQPVLAPAMFAELALSIEMCPIHMQDLQSCRDDDILADTLSDLSNPPSTLGYDVPLSTCRPLR